MRVVLALLALLLVPTALGQLGLVAPTLTTFADDPGRAFLPGTNERVVVHVNYAPGQSGRPAPAPTPDRPENTTPTRITFVAKAIPSWVTNVTFDPPEILIQMGVENAARASYTATAIAIFAVSPDAPALVREPFLFTAIATENGNIQAASADSPELKLRAATVGLLNVTAEPTAILPGGRWTVVPFTVTNLGNSEIVAKLNVTVRPENSQVEFTETVQLARGEARNVEVRVRTPWTAAEFGTLELEAVPILDGEAGESARAEVAVRGESAVPGIGAAPLVGLAAALAMLGRRRG